MPAGRIAWIDTETTGVDEREEVAGLLEVACLVTDTDLNILDPEGYQAVVYHDGDTVQQMIANIDPYVVNMHRESGLWGRVLRGKPAEVIDLELLAYLRQFSTEPNKLYLGGNSITLDRNFLRGFLPFTFEHVSYRSFDVTSLALAAQWRFGSDFRYRKQYRHEAFADIVESIAEARFLLDNAFAMESELAVRHLREAV